MLVSAWECTKGSVLDLKYFENEQNGIFKEKKKKTGEPKKKYKRMLEWKLQKNNARDIWSGTRTITGF